MTRQIINVGVADKGNGDPIRTAFIKANANFAELYNILSNNTGGSIITTDVIGSVFADESTLLVDGINGSIPYSVLSGAPTIPAAQVQSNWTATNGMGVILNKPTLFSGSYTDLTNKPTAFSFSVAADDSTQRAISSNESIKFIGSGGITTASDAEGNITINYVQGNIRSEGNINIEINLADSTLRRWRFGEDGDTVFPNNVSINYSGNNIQFPRIIADSGKAFSVQGQGTSGSAALSWTVNPDAAGQYAAVAVSKGGGDNLAKVILQAQSDSGDAGTAKIWKFDETGNITFPNTTVQSTAYIAPTTGNSVISSIDNITISRNGMTIRVTSAGMIQMSFNSVISITGRSSINNADSVVIASPNGATVSGTQYNIGALALGDHLTATIVDASFHRIYRLTVIMRDKDTTPGLELAVAYAIIEQIQ